MLNKEKIRRKITQKVIDPKKGYSINVKILRQDTNVFNEKTGGLFVCTLDGYYHTNTRLVQSVLGDSGRVPRGFNEKLMVVYDDNSLAVKVNDYFVYNGITYQILDKGPKLDIYFDFDLQRIDNGIT